AGQPFPGNKIPAYRFSAASKFLFPYILTPNSPGNLFQALAPQPDNGTNFTMRVDQVINSKQKVYARWIRVGDGQTSSGYRPDVITSTTLVQHNGAVNYDYTIAPWMLFTFTGGFVHSDYTGSSPLVGKENLTADA